MSTTINQIIEWIKKIDWIIWLATAGVIIYIIIYIVLTTVFAGQTTGTTITIWAGI